MTRTRQIAMTAVALTATLALAACGGDADDDATGTDTGADTGTDGGSGEGGEELVVVRVGETAGIPSAFLEYAVAEGFFEDEGIDLQVDTSAGGAAAIPGMLSGDLDISGGNAVSALLAADQGLPVVLFAPGTFGTDDPEEDFSAVLVPEDSDIQDATDLPGYEVAVNHLQNIGDITVSAAVEAAGADPSGISYVELGFPDMLAALDAGHVDAVWIIEPFRTIGMQAGDRVVSHPYAEAYPNLQIGVFQTTQEYADGNPEVIDSFRAALSTTVDSVLEDPDAFRSALTEIAGIDEAVAQEMVLPHYGHEIDVASLEFLTERMQQEGYIDDTIDLDALVLE